MINTLAWMLILSAPPPGAMPELVAVVNRDFIDHEACHAFHAQLRNQYGRPTVYLGGGLAAVVDEPPVRLSEVASAVVDAGMRGPSYDLYLVQAQRWWDRQPSYILDEQAAYIAGTFWYRHRNDLQAEIYSAARARELSRYATVLLRLARALPGYDARQLAAIVEYQWLRVGSLTGADHPAMQARSTPAAVERSATAQRRAVRFDSGAPSCCPDGDCAVPWQPVKPSSAGATAHNSRGPAPAAESARQRILPVPDSAPAGATGAQRRPALADDTPTYHVVTYTAAWCAPCRTLKPLWAKLRNRGVLVTEADVDHLPAWIKENPASVPHTMLYRWDGRAWVFVERWNGAGWERAIEEAVK